MNWADALDYLRNLKRPRRGDYVIAFTQEAAATILCWYCLARVNGAPRDTPIKLCAKCRR